MFNDIFDELNRVFNDVSNGVKEAQKRGRGFIAVDVRKDNDGYLVEAALPGVKKEDVSINYDQSVLTIEVKEHEVANDSFIIKERMENFYKRELDLPDAEPSQIKAKMQDGILVISLPFVKKTSNLISIE